MSALHIIPVLTQKDILRRLFIVHGREVGAADAARVAATSPNPPPAPYIRAGSPHYLYALYVTQGTPHAEACELLGISSSTAYGWRKTYMAIAKEYFGRDVSYEFVADYCTDMETQRVYAEIKAEIAAEVASETNSSVRQPTPKLHTSSHYDASRHSS